MLTSQRLASSGFGARPGAAAAAPIPASSIECECSICGKTFDRRDLRDRHKRRCAKSWAKPRQSKRRSCLPCAASKLGCGLEKPSCLRCRQREAPCHYFDAPDEGRARQTAQGEHALLPSPNENDDVGSIQTFSTWSSFSAEDFPVSGDSMMSLLLDTARVTGASEIPGWEQSLLQGLAWPGDVTVLPPSQADPSPQPPHPSSTAYQGVGAGSASVSQMTSAGTDDDARRPEQSQTRESPAPALPELELRLGIEPASSGDSAAASDLAATEQLVDTLHSYLQLMIGHRAYPPFVHQRIYRCYEGDVLEPLAKAFCCISAQNVALPSSHGFVGEMMKNEQERLVHSFQSCSNDVDMLAAVHAMIVYQVLGFFGRIPVQERMAELQNTYLLKMARKLAAKHRHDLLLVDAADDAASDWPRWILLETVRRTLFVVHGINVLSARMQKQKAFFYEPLDDALVFDMPLPAPDPLWRAATAGEWIRARSGLPPRTRVMARREAAKGQAAEVEAHARDDGMGDFLQLVISTVRSQGSLG